MQQRPLGRSGLSTAPLVFGGNVFGWTADEATSFRLLDAFVGAGFNLIDTADVYSRWVPGHAGGESETVIGRWLKKSGKRHHQGRQADERRRRGPHRLVAEVDPPGRR
jgi:aryl-alcohol dehydrogenase-like predicted oxidoreductase